MKRFVIGGVGAVVAVVVVGVLLYGYLRLRPQELRVDNRMASSVSLQLGTTSETEIPANSMGVMRSGWLLNEGSLVVVSGRIGKQCSWADVHDDQPLVIDDEGIHCLGPVLNPFANPDLTPTNP